MWYIGVITHLLSIDPNFLDIQVHRFGSPWTRGVPDPVRRYVTSARHLGPHRPPRCHKMVDVSEIRRENHRLVFSFVVKKWDTPKKTNMSTENPTIGRSISYWNWAYSNVMLVFRGVNLPISLAEFLDRRFLDFPLFSLVFQLLETHRFCFFAKQVLPVIP